MEAIKKIELEEIVRGIPGGFFIYSAGSGEEIIYANHEVLKIYGCDTMEEFRKYTGNSFQGMIHPEDLEWVEESINTQIYVDQKNYDYVEYRILTKNGIVRWVEDFGHFVKSDVYDEVFYVFVSDVTDKMQYKFQRQEEMQELLEDQEFLKKSLETAVYAYREVYVVDLKNNYYRMIYPEAGPEAESGDFRQGMKNHLMQGKIADDNAENILQLLQPENIRKTLKDRDTVEFRYRRSRPDGTIEWCATVFTVNERVDGDPQTVVMGIRSIDSMIRKEEQQRILLENALLRAQQANEAKTVFLANISHDIRTPMNAIIGFTELGMRHTDDSDKMRRCLDKIQSSSRQLLELIDDILDMSRVESGRITIEEEANYMQEIMDQVYQMAEKILKEKKLKYTCDLSNVKNGCFYCDALRVKQILFNVIENAAKFTPPQGEITVTVKQFKSLSNEIETYEIAVRDTGIGISGEFLPKLFLPFEREKSPAVSGIQGTGLGLSITKNVVELMNGTIDVQSEVGKGSCFTIRLPFRVLRQEEEQTENQERFLGMLKDTYNTLKDKHVLLVEDNELNREIAKELLEEAGVLVDEAEDGEVAVEMVKRSDGKYDVILMDIQMPKMDGYQTARAIRSLENSRLSTVPIIALSANAFEEDKRKAVESGMNGHLSKPIEIEKVLETMRQFVRNETEDHNVQ